MDINTHTQPQLDTIIPEVGYNSTTTKTGPALKRCRILEKRLWPGKIKYLQEPPSQLFIRGETFWNKKIPAATNSQMQQLEPTLICIVGSRRCSTYGRDVTKRLMRELIPYNVAIVSGLAYGIDSEAHSAALKYGIPTIAIPGSGLSNEVIYPRTHVDLAEKIVANGGAIISEYAEDVIAHPFMFPMRNRLMAAASSIVVVIEAEKTSGTRTTVDTALSMGINVGAVPGALNSALSVGTNGIIQSGAYLITCGKDIAEIVCAVEKERLRQPAPEQRTLSFQYSSEGDLEKEILLALSVASHSPASLAHLVNQPIEKVIRVLTKLCIDGHVSLGNDGRYCV